MKLENIHNVYFIGIGGIGMSALARYFLNKDCNVAGYDRSSTTLTKALEEEGAIIQYNDAINEIPKSHKHRDTLVIYTPAIPENSDLLNYFKNNEFTVLKRSEVLGEITHDVFTIGVAGTHGKTTTSTMIAHVLYASSPVYDAFLGGISTNFNSNYVFSKRAKAIIVEADEYDRSFLTLFPDIAVITSTDADHLDIYGEHSSLLDGFQEYADKLPKDGLLVIKKGLKINHPNKVTYSIKEEADYYAFDISVQDGVYSFSIKTPTQVVERVTVGIGGLHNVENALAAFIVAEKMGLETQEIIEGLASFSGIKRRFEYISKGDIIYIDDYAHHPTELNACINSVRQMYPDKRVTGIFQPHLYSRTKDFAEDFAKSLSLLDELYLLDIYPARELPIEGVDSKLIFDKVTIPKKVLTSKESVLDELDLEKTEVIITLGAGDIDSIVPLLKEKIEHELAE